MKKLPEQPADLVPSLPEFQQYVSDPKLLEEVTEYNKRYLYRDVLKYRIEDESTGKQYGR